jgi:hypothetical protein
MFLEIISKLKMNNIKVDKCINSTREYKIYKGRFPMSGLKMLPGSYDGWWERRDSTILVPEESVTKFIDILDNVNSDFDYYGITTEYSKDQIALLIELLTERIYEMQNNKNYMFHHGRKIINYNDYYLKNNIEFRKYKKQIIKMLVDFVDWLKNIEDDRINILGV